jgi:glyoxylase-like metal-dependent hydrolase (beta-lactamase superfamily II)
MSYLNSLRSTRALDATVVWPGHGPPIHDHRTLITKRLSHHEERAEHILGLLHEHSRSAHALARAIWGERALTQVYLTLSEVLGHLDVLVAAGLAAEEHGETVCFHATG